MILTRDSITRRVHYQGKGHCSAAAVRAVDGRHTHCSRPPYALLTAVEQ
ncbi:MAG: hypothetical protein HXL32_00310 [Prevotellaceae bacterium]|nr:hypothetical protein [Prevotellaceae bacterium]